MISRFLVGLIRIYQRFLSPYLGRSCRFYPSCSEFTAQAVLKFGVLKGILLGIRRILCCNPFHAGGFDPVP